MKDYWKRRLTPWDTELLVMVESLTGKPCEALNGGDSYFFEADYELHPEPEYILAIWDAIEGRAGKRLVDIKDDPERHCIIAHVAFSTESLPGLIHLHGTGKASPREGNLYIDNYGSLAVALDVRKDNAERMVSFVGNGELEVPKDGPCVFHFINAGGVFADAPAGAFIIYRGKEHFEVMPGEKFVNEYHLFR